MKVATLYLSTSHIVPSTLIVSKKNECSGTIAAVDQGEKTNVVDFDTILLYKILGHMSEKV